MVNKAFRDRIDFLPFLIPLFLMSMVMFAFDFEEVAPLSLVGSLVPFGFCVYKKVIPFNPRTCIRRGERRLTVIVPNFSRFSLWGMSQSRLKFQHPISPEIGEKNLSQLELKQVHVIEDELDPLDRKKNEVFLPAKLTTEETRTNCLHRNSQFDTSPANVALGTTILHPRD